MDYGPATPTTASMAHSSFCKSAQLGTYRYLNNLPYWPQAASQCQKQQATRRDFKGG